MFAEDRHRHARAELPHRSRFMNHEPWTNSPIHQRANTGKKTKTDTKSDKAGRPACYSSKSNAASQPA